MPSHLLRDLIAKLDGELAAAIAPAERAIRIDLDRLRRDAQTALKPQAN